MVISIDRSIYSYYYWSIERSTLRCLNDLMIKQQTFVQMAVWNIINIIIIIINYWGKIKETKQNKIQQTKNE